MFRSSNVQHSSSITIHSHRRHSHTSSSNLHGYGYPSKNAVPRPAVVPTATATASTTSTGLHANLSPISASMNASSTVLSYKQAATGGTITESNGNYSNTGGSLASHSHSMSNCHHAPYVPLPINTASLKKEYDKDHHLGFVSLKASNDFHRNSDSSGGERPVGESNWMLD